MTQASHNADATTRELVITRVFDAPRELVFQAWTDPKHLAHWWGPKGFTMEISKMDFQPGGIFHYCQRSPQGHTMWGKFVFQEIEAPERLAFVNSIADEAGNTIPNPWNAALPREILNVLTFSEQDGKTTLTMRGCPVNATEAEHKTFEGMHENVKQGFGGTFEQLDSYLAGLTAGSEA